MCPFDCLFLKTLKGGMNIIWQFNFMKIWPQVLPGVSTIEKISISFKSVLKESSKLSR